MTMRKGIQSIEFSKTPYIKRLGIGCRTERRRRAIRKCDRSDYRRSLFWTEKLGALLKDVL